MIRNRRRGALAVAAIVALAPMAAGCAAGFNAQTSKPYSPADGINTSLRAIDIRALFVLGPQPGAVLTVGEAAPVYFSLFNNADRADRLVAVEAPGAATSARIEGGSLDLPVGQLVSASGPAPRVVLEGLTRPLRGGEYVSLVLRFANAGSITVNAPVMTREEFYATYSPAPTPTPQATGSPSPTKTP